MLPDPVYVTVHAKTCQRRANAFEFEQLETREKTQLRWKRTNPAFAGVRVHILVRSPAYTGERTAFISNTIERSSVF